MTEIEVKIRIDDPKTFREKILGLGAVVSRDRHLERNSLFDFAPRSSTRRAGPSACARRGSGPR